MAGAMLGFGFALVVLVEFFVIAAAWLAEGLDA